ncbi:hypothetical protein [Helicobacter pylori]|uniref:hypothetical protein n=1 Tax=Helicobacter pylori TaxID=210 RepID=UPI0009B12520|nr:hypothetical protein [Helicobacter pylori]
MTPLIKNLNSSSLARILFYNIKSNQLLMKENLALIFDLYCSIFEKLPQRILNFLLEFFLPQLPASRFNI